MPESAVSLVDRILDRHAEASAADRRTIIGLVGAPGSGKTTLLHALLVALELRVPGSTAWVPMDGFHLADSTLRDLGRLKAKGAIDTFDGYGYLATLRRIRVETGNIVYAPEFDRTLEQPIAGGMAVPPAATIVLTEGNYLLDEGSPWNALPGVLDEIWYCDVADELRRERLVARHVAFGKSPEAARAWVGTVDEPNAVRIRSTRSRADLVVSTDHPVDVHETVIIT